LLLQILQRLYKGFTERFRDEDETARERAGFRLSPSNIKVKKRKGIEHGHRHAQSLFWKLPIDVSFSRSTPVPARSCSFRSGKKKGERRLEKTRSFFIFLPGRGADASS
jgi:hypothetical protein